MDPQTYLAEIKAKLASSLAVASVFIVEERALPDQGYLRARMRLQNGDFLEIVEYFVAKGGQCVTRRYRHQWMDAAQNYSGSVGITWSTILDCPILHTMPT